MSDLILRPTGFKPTPLGHPKYGAPTLTEAFDVAKLRLLPLDQIPPFRYVRFEVPNLDQGQTNECVPTTWTMVEWIDLVKLGMTPPPLSPAWLYSWINGGSDNGSSPGDAITTLQLHGLAPASMVPPDFLGPPAGYNTQARNAALAYKLRGTVRVTTFLEAANAAFFDLVGGMDVCAGPGLRVDGNGIMNLNSGPNDHEVMIGEAFIRIDGQPLIRGRNPWGWPMWLTQAHIEAANEIDFSIGAVISVTDPSLPPAMK